MQRGKDGAERLLGAAYFTWAWVPEGNTGGTNARAFDRKKEARRHLLRAPGSFLPQWILRSLCAADQVAIMGGSYGGYARLAATRS